MNHQTGFRTMVENKDTGGSAPGELDLGAVEADDSSKRSGVNPDGPTNFWAHLGCDQAKADRYVEIVAASTNL